MSVWISADRRRTAFVAAAALVVVASVFYALILKFGIFGDRAVTTIDDLGEAVAAAIASGACAWAATRATTKNRLGWALMGIGSTGRSRRCFKTKRPISRWPALRCSGLPQRGVGRLVRSREGRYATGPVRS